MGRFCVLVASSDKGFDIFDTCFRNAEDVWRSCPWPRFVGVTTRYWATEIYGFQTIEAHKPSNWQGELRDQLDQLPGEIEYILLLIEDAFVTKVPDLSLVATIIASEGLAYTSLIALRRNIFGRAIEFVRRRLSNEPFRQYSPSEPYYSSFGVVIWRRDHLRWLLSQPGSVWDLEHIVSPEPHYAVWKTLFKPDHLVIKGKWALRAHWKLKGLGVEEGRRGFRPLKECLRDLRETISFHTLGFLSFRIRRRLNRISHRAP